MKAASVKKVSKKRPVSVRRRIPYPFVPPSADAIADWDEYYIWCAARYRARDNFARFWRYYGVVLPAVSEKWDPPIPEPSAAGERPTDKVALKKVKIPADWKFEANALPEAAQKEYERQLEE